MNISIDSQFTLNRLVFKLKTETYRKMKIVCDQRSKRFQT